MSFYKTDLKKLIKYDQCLLCTCKELNEVSGSSYIETSPDTLRTSNSMSSHTGNEYNHAEGLKTAHTHHHMEQKYITCTRSLAHTVQSGKWLITFDLPSCSIKWSVYCCLEIKHLLIYHPRAFNILVYIYFFNTFCSLQIAVCTFHLQLTLPANAIIEYESYVSGSRMKSIPCFWKNLKYHSHWSAKHILHLT